MVWTDDEKIENLLKATTTASVIIMSPRVADYTAVLAKAQEARNELLEGWTGLVDSNSDIDNILRNAFINADVALLELLEVATAKNQDAIAVELEEHKKDKK